MKNNENISQHSNSKNSEDSDFFESSYYKNNTAIEYPYYLHNPTESLSASQSNSNFTMSISNPIHAAKTSKNEQSESNLNKSIDDSKRKMNSTQHAQSTSTPTQVKNTIGNLF